MFLNSIHIVITQHMNDVMFILVITRYSHLLGVGGGSGIFSINALKTWPHLQITIFELPHIVDITREFTKETTISVAVKLLSKCRGGIPNLLTNSGL